MQKQWTVRMFSNRDGGDGTGRLIIKKKCDWSIYKYRKRMMY